MMPLRQMLELALARSRRPVDALQRAHRRNKRNKRNVSKERWTTRSARAWIGIRGPQVALEIHVLETQP